MNIPFHPRPSPAWRIATGRAGRRRAGRPQPADRHTSPQASRSNAGGRGAGPGTTVALDPVYAARTQAAEDVEVRARVQGTLLRRHSHRGQPGQGRRPTVRDRSRAVRGPRAAGRRRPEAAPRRAGTPGRAGADTHRRHVHQKDNAVSARDRDAALSALELAQAGVATAQAQLRDARIQLGYTKVTAPISGHAGMRALSEGNLVSANALLTTVRKLDPIQVAEHARGRRRGTAPACPTGGYRQPGCSSTASWTLADGTRYAQSGVIDFHRHHPRPADRHPAGARQLCQPRRAVAARAVRAPGAGRFSTLPNTLVAQQQKARARREPPCMWSIARTLPSCAT